MVECWMCPTNNECKHEKKYCKRYTIKASKSRLPRSIKEYEEIRQKEKEYWDRK